MTTLSNTLVFVKFEKLTVEIELSCFFPWNTHSRHVTARHESWSRPCPKHDSRRWLIQYGQKCDHFSQIFRSTAKQPIATFKIRLPYNITYGRATKAVSAHCPRNDKNGFIESDTLAHIHVGFVLVVSCWMVSWRECCSSINKRKNLYVSWLRGLTCIAWWCFNVWLKQLILKSDDFCKNRLGRLLFW